MSAPNKNCHVSTKWEDTGGNNPECDATVLLNPDPNNDISLQELIENELALRSSCSAAATNGVDCPKMLICDTDDVDDDPKARSESLIFSEKRTSAAEIVNVSRSNSIRSNSGRPVAQVDDFDVLYDEEVNAAAKEVIAVANGHAELLVDTSETPAELVTTTTATTTIRTTTSSTSASTIRDTRSPNEFDANSRGDGAGTRSPDDAKTNSVVLDSLETAVTDELTLSSLSTAAADDVGAEEHRALCCNGDTNTVVVDKSCAALNAPNDTNLDFVPVADVNVVVESSTNQREPSSFCKREPVRPPASVPDDDDWVCVRDATMTQDDEVDDAKALIVDGLVKGDHVPEPKCAVEVPCQTLAANDEGSTSAGRDAAATSAPSCKIVDQTFAANVADPPAESSTAPQCNGWREDEIGREPDVLVLNMNGDDYYFGYGRAANDQRAEESSPRSEDRGTFAEEESSPRVHVKTVASVGKYVSEKSETKLIEECCYNLTQCNIDVVSESNVAEKKSVKKKKSTSEESVTTTKTKKTKKTKKYEEKENISVSNGLPQNDVDDPRFHQILDDGDELSNVCVRDLKIMYCNEANKTKDNKLAQYEEPVPASIPIKELKSGFGKFDQLTKKNVMHVRSSDPAKSQQQFSQNDQDSGSLCRACNKNVFAMEQIKAERHVWHKNCFRCKTCNKQLTVDVYSSHEGELFCKPHFRDLFKPKVVVEEEKPASDKPDLGLEELSSLNVKSRFQVFEKQTVEENADKSPVCVKRSPSILSKLAKFQAKGIDVGVSSEIFNGIDYEESSSSEEEPVQNDNVVRNSVTKEKPIAFNKMNDVKKNWENGQASRREERQEERRQERQNIRSRLFMGKQNKMREAYENAVAESERGNVKKDVEVKSEMARSIKEKFEKGEIIHNEESDEEQEKKSGAKNDDMDVFEAGISKKSRSLFQQMDAAIKTQSNNNSFSSPPHAIQNGHRSRTESESPEREIPQNSDVVRCEDQIDNESEVLKKSNTTAKMLSLFRQLEEAQEIVPDGLKPMKKFTPPPASSSSSEAESEDESEEPSEASVVHDDVVRACDKTEDEYLKMAQKAEKAKALKEKFEKWEPEKQSTNNAVNLLDSEQASLDTTKSLRARFESLKAEQPSDKPRPKVNRFV